MREVRGHDNKTAANIADTYAKVIKEAKKNRPKENDQTMTRVQREWCINSLAFIACDLSLQDLGDRGIQMGRRLYESVKSFARSGDLIYCAPAENYQGRKRLRAEEGIQNAWVDSSQIVSRTNTQGENLRVAHGGKARVAASIVRNFQCSIASAYRYCPPVVVRSRKNTDLCLFCEALRKVRIECVRIANSRGGNFPLPGEFPGQGAVREPGNGAAHFLRPFATENPEIEKALEEFDVLMWHEGLNRTLTAEMKASCGKKMVVIFDFSGNVPLKGIRGDANEFFRPQSLSLFGAMIIAPVPGGEFTRNYVDVFSFDTASHTSNEGVACLQCALSCAREQKIVPLRPPEIAFWSDKAKHFCSGEMAHGVLFDVSKGVGNVSYTYHACYHGKTPLDAHFARVKQAIDQVAVEKWPSSEKLVLGPVRKLGRTQAVFLDSGYESRVPRNKLIVRDISSVQKLRRVTSPRSHQDKLFVEDTEIPIRTASQGEPEHTDPDLAVFRNLRNAPSADLCGKLKQQRTKLFRYLRNASPTSRRFFVFKRHFKRHFTRRSFVFKRQDAHGGDGSFCTNEMLVRKNPRILPVCAALLRR